MIYIYIIALIYYMLYLNINMCESVEHEAARSLRKALHACATSGETALAAVGASGEAASAGVAPAKRGKRHTVYAVGARHAGACHVDRARCGDTPRQVTTWHAPGGPAKHPLPFGLTSATVLPRHGPPHYVQDGWPPGWKLVMGDLPADTEAAEAWRMTTC